jgi:hypothetical protein
MRNKQQRDLREKGIMSSLVEMMQGSPEKWGKVFHHL